MNKIIESNITYIEVEYVLEEPLTGAQLDRFTEYISTHGLADFTILDQISDANDPSVWMGTVVNPTAQTVEDVQEALTLHVNKALEAAYTTHTLQDVNPHK